MHDSFAFCPHCKHWVPAEFMRYDGTDRVCTACLFEAGLERLPGFARKPFNHQPEGQTRRIGGEFTWKIINGVPTKVWFET